MGLLDNLYLGHNADFGGVGGLLSKLQTMQAQNQQYQPSTGFGQSPMDANAQQQAAPMDIGGYQMPRIGSEQQFTPDPATIPQNAQPTQGQMPMQAPQQSSGGSALTGLQSFLNGGGLISSIRGAMDGRRVDQRGVAEQQQNQTAQFLVSKGIDPAMAKTIVSDPAALRAILPSIMGTGGQTEKIKEFERAQRDPAFAKYMESQRAGSGEVSLNPVWGEDDKGKPVLGQLNKRGEFVQTKLPPGVTPSKGVDRVDLGTEWGVVSKVNGQLVGKYSKNIEGKESAEERGKAQGLAQVALPNAIANAQQTLDIIKSIKEDPYRERGTGASSILNKIPATGGYDFAQKLEQLKGKAFLEAFQSLKGGGAITEIEGKKAENAIARLSAGQSEGAFLEALNELETIVTAGMGRARARAGQGGTTPAPMGGASVDDLLKKYGGK